MDETSLIFIEQILHLNSFLLELLLLQLIPLSFTKLKMGTFSHKLVISGFVLRPILVVHKL